MEPTDIAQALGRIEQKVDDLRVLVGGHVEKDNSIHTVMDWRVRTLERRASWLAGAAAVLGFALALVKDSLARLFK